MRADALRRGLQVDYGRGYEDLTLPYLPCIEVLHSLLDRLPHDLEYTLGDDAEVIRWFLHRDRAAAHVMNPSTSTQSEQDKSRLFVAVARTAMTLAQRRPTIIVVDDLHWADRASIDLFGRLVFTLADTAVREAVPLLIVGSYRPVEAEIHVGHLLARLQREQICRTFTLPGLNEVETRELVQGLGLLRPSHQLIATVNEATQGNPLFIQGEGTERTIASFRQIGDLPGLARALMAQARSYNTAVSYGNLGDLHPLEETLAMLGESEPELRCSILIGMSEVYWVGRQPDKAAEMAQRALEIGRDLVHDPLCALASCELGISRNQELYVEEALEHYRQARVYAQRIRDHWFDGWLLHRIPTALILLGRFDEAEAIARGRRSSSAMRATSFTS